MDLNYLYQRHQVSLYMAEHGASEQARRTNRALAAAYAARIAGARSAAGAASAERSAS